MIIHVIGNAKNLEEDLPFVHEIVETVHDYGAVIARDWMSAAQHRLDKKIIRDDSKVDWDAVNRENVDAINRADLVIIETTSYTFQEGLYASKALAAKKPVLILTRNNPKGLLLSGLKDRFLEVKQYTSKDDIRSIVGSFLKSNTIAAKDLRFNFFLDRQMYSYLRDVSYETGKNKSEIIRELLAKEIEKRD